MICKLCGKDYSALGNHIRRKHGITPYDYRREFNIPLTKPLQEDWLCKMQSITAIERLKYPEEKERLLAVGKKGHGKARGKRNLPDCSKEHCHENNQKKSNDFRNKYLPLVEPDWRKGLCQHEIGKKHKVSTHVLKKWMEEGILPRRKRVVYYLVVEDDNEN